LAEPRPRVGAEQSTALEPRKRASVAKPAGWRPGSWWPTDRRQWLRLIGVAAAVVLLLILGTIAYAAATLLAAGYAADLPKAIAATNYLTGQLNADGRLYSTIDTAASLALLLGLRAAGVVTTADGGLVEVNGQQMKLADALASSEKVEALRCIEGVVAVEVTTEVIEDWRTFKSVLPVEVRLECNGRAQKSFKVGDALDLVIGVPRYEPGMIAHICLPEALARIVGGGQVKRFSLDFCEKNVLRVPLAATSSTALPAMKDAESEQTLLSWLGIIDKRASNAQHWAVIVRNMFKEEQIGNPGRLEVIVE